MIQKNNKHIAYLGLQTVLKPIANLNTTSCKLQKGGISTMFTVKQVAQNLQVSTQAIYKQKDELISKGFMIKNNSNQWEITPNGFNYLQDKKITFMQQHTTETIQPPINQVANKEYEEKTEEKQTVDMSTNDKVANIIINHYKEQLQTVTNQLQEMTEQRDYFKAKFEEKDNLCNQYMNSHLLPPTEDEIQAKLNESNQNKKNKNFWTRLFNK